ncbi:hypothetical protein [Rhodovulum steppense]|uniref:Tat pathway signal sequence domain protein n=1 Tax=Rhodovulum steppense TaxID=540251 RepID=A0A4R1YU00_9RHOB|nr:hypothetical protein [Rhodovulum steppense]TCM84530.1 hypothetical protein EV216_11110 [Rhodovulum steppense]
MIRRNQILRLAALSACLTALPLAAGADDASAALSLELNAVAEAEGGCLLTFVAENGHATDIAAAVFETVLMDATGRVERLTLFDFGTLPAGRPRVRQFVVPDLACADLGRVLINGAHLCEAGEPGLAPCAEGLRLGTRTDVEVIG